MTTAGTRSTCLQVELDADARGARVRLLDGWRDAVGPDGIGPAVHAAVVATVQRRLVAAMEAGPARAPTVVPALPGTLDEQAMLVSRAVRELVDFRRHTAELAERVDLVQDAGQKVTVTVQGMQIAAVDVDADWARSASDAAVESALRTALCTGLAIAADRPGAALAGCPELESVLRAAGSPVPNAEAER